MLLFNNYSLDATSGYKNFNTSNVTIQPVSQIEIKATSIYFNTSNVTIQPIKAFSIKRLAAISIHLMLLFNITTILAPSPYVSFQYI